MAELHIEKVSTNYWSVRQGDKELGCVLGAGPTAGTRFKAISKDDGWMNPEDAPQVGYAQTLEQAAKLLT